MRFSALPRTRWQGDHLVVVTQRGDEGRIVDATAAIRAFEQSCGVDVVWMTPKQ